jgi:hypothetical protein
VVRCWRGLGLSDSHLWLSKVDTRIYVVQDAAAQYPMSTGDVVLLCVCVGAIHG